MVASASSAAGSALRLEALGHALTQRGVLLLLTAMVTAIAADSTVADEPLLDFIHNPLRSLGNTPGSTGSPSSALPASNYTAVVSPESPRAQPSSSEDSSADITHFQLELVTPESSKPLEAKHLLADDADPLPVPSLRPSKPGFSSPFETAAQLSPTWKPPRSNSAQQLFSAPPWGSQLQPQSNKHMASPSPSAFARLTAPQQGRNSEPTLAALTSLPGLPLGSPNLAFADSQADQSYGNVLDVNQLRPSISPLEEKNQPLDVNILPHPDEIPAQSYNVPFIAPDHTSPLSEPTEVSPEDFYPTNTMDVDWGSGDYLETMSFLNPEGEDYSPVTKLPSDSYDFEDYTEVYDTSFPSRVGVIPSSLHHLGGTPTSSLVSAYSTLAPLKSIIAPSSTPAIHHVLKPTLTIDAGPPATSDVDWPDTFTIQPTDVLLPDMNSLEYYTIQLTKDNNSTDTGAEHRANVSIVSFSATDISPTSSFTNDTVVTEGQLYDDLSGLEPHQELTTVMTTEKDPQLFNVSEPFLQPSVVPTLPSSTWPGQVSTKEDWTFPTLSVGNFSTLLGEPLVTSATPLLPDDFVSYSSLTDVHWFVTESFSQSTAVASPIPSATITLTSIPATLPPNTTAHLTESTPDDSDFTTFQSYNSSITSGPVTNVTLVPPDVLGDQGVTEDVVDIPATMTLIPTSSDSNPATSAPTTTTTASSTFHQATTRATATTNTESQVTINSTTSGKPTTSVTPSRQYLCNLENPAHLVKISFPSGATTGYAKSQVRDILKVEFNKSVELQVVNPPPKFIFRVVSGPVVYTAISVISALQRSRRRFMSVTPSWISPDRKHQIHTVLQFVPGHVDVRFCNFSESIEKGLTMAFAEVRRRSKESTNFTVHILNITKAPPQYQDQRLVRQPVDITFTVQGPNGYLLGSEVSNALLELTTVEFSYYMGFPVLQIAEPFHYPELNTSQVLRSSWLRTVLLGVQDQKVGERTFQASMERRMAMLLGEAMGLVRRVKRATSIGNSSVQVVRASRLEGEDHPLEVVYFIEGASGHRMPATEAAHLLNSMDVQRAAIVLGYRVQGVLAQPVEKVASPPSSAENTNVWIVIGVVVPLLVVFIILSVLYWKLCRTDKLEFQPDAMTSIQQRQKLQAPSVKGFDFAKLHLGQQSKDDIMVIQEPVPSGPGPGAQSMPSKDGFSPSKNGDVPTPASKNSSSKASRSSRRRERISPSDGDSVVSDRSSERESTEENLRGLATPGDGKHSRKVPINVLNGKNRIGPPPMNGAGEQLSSASIFEHVDRMSRGADASKRLPNKVQLIAMQPMAVPPLHGAPAAAAAANGKLSNANQINKEIQVALRHKSEIEHHRNKIRLRAKRKGHYDFPAMDEITGGYVDGKDQDHIYQKAQMQIDKILDPDAQVTSIFMGSKKSGRGRRSPKHRLKEQLNGGMMEADKDQLITEDADMAYRKCPGVNNVAYVSDPDQGQGGSPHRSPSPTDDVFLGPASSPPGHAPPPPPYMPPQPSIEEARQQMHSLLDDAFALVSPTSQGGTAGITLPGVGANPPASSPPGRGPRHWAPTYAPFPGRFSEPALSPPSVQGLITRSALGSSYLPQREAGVQCEQLQADSLFTSRGLYADDLPSSARPRPVGGTTGAQLHHLTQVGLSSRLNGFPAGVRAPPGYNGGLGWNHYHDDHFPRTELEKDALLDCPDFLPPSIFQTPRGVASVREPSAPPVHLDTPVVSYLSAAPLPAPPLDVSPPPHSSASLIKAIREELLRLSQKQAAVPPYHS